MLYSVVPGTTFALPDGDFVSPAEDGWSNVAGYALSAAPNAPERTLAEQLEIERADMSMSFSQGVIGLTEQGWITEQEADDWLAALALPAVVQAVIASLPDALPDGAKPRLRARARALRPTAFSRTDALFVLMAALRGVTPEQTDDFFRHYSSI